MEKFFEFAMKRHSIYLRRQAGEVWPWSDDPILNKYRFTNVYRELDATTAWFRTWVRDPMRSSPEVLLATVVFRWFNRVRTGEAIFRQETLSGGTAWDAFLAAESTEEGLARVRQSIVSYCGESGPFVTGAYIVKTPNGYEKLDGVLKAIEWFVVCISMLDGRQHSWRQVADHCLEREGRVRIEDVWAWLREFPFMGDFMAYEVVTDLRHTDLLHRAPDIMEWANPGPGAMRGLDRLHGRYGGRRQHKSHYIREMRELLDQANQGAWPNSDQYPPLEMRDVEHTLCEFDKYERTRNGEGRPRGVFRQ